MTDQNLDRPHALFDEIHGIRDELDEIRDRVDAKQERIHPSIWIPLAIWIIATTISGTWWAASTSTQLDQVVSEGIADRYKGADAKADFALRDSKILNLQRQLDRLHAEYSAHNARPAHKEAMIEHAQYKEHMRDRTIHQVHR